MGNVAPYCGCPRVPWVRQIIYGRAFFDYVDAGSVPSARVVVDELFNLLRPDSVLDVGCGRGGWLAAWESAGCAQVCGVDGDYVDRTQLVTAHPRFDAAELSALGDI